MGYLIFRGVSTESLTGVAVSKMPAHKKASMRYTEYYVKGRDGALHVDEGLSDFEIQATLVLIDGAATTRQIVNAWADGTGKLITSDDLTKAYRATVKKEIKWTRVPGNSGFYDIAQITWICKPYMYEAVETVAEYTSNGTIVNQTSATAQPLIKVEGSGNCNIRVSSNTADVIRLTGVVSGTPVFLDSETGYVYTASGAATMTGNFPELPIGTTSVILGGNVTKLTITPRWRWI